MKIEQVEFEVPSPSEFPALFVGYVAVGYAGGRWWCGADTDSKDDAFCKMQDAARLALLPAVQADLTKRDVTFFPNTVKVFRVDTTEGA